MNGEERREQILNRLKTGKGPVSGTELARELEVSRQVVVQDIALLRAFHKNILATNKGYLYFCEEEEEDKYKRTIKVRHKDSEILDEFYTIVDCGGKVLDVVVEHEIYGQITVDLIINSRQDADNFVNKCRNSTNKTLNVLTDGIHYHTVEAANKEALNLIEKRLLEKGYLIKE
ncbi:MAG: transcription repressor NadR [Roseburia sp.]|nr:transcription repressor NadR [Roseburia sp.]MCM1280192.1 transcription repressor NadR [Robinsoniella sp.]